MKTKRVGVKLKLKWNKKEGYPKKKKNEVEIKINNKVNILM